MTQKLSGKPFVGFAVLSSKHPVLSSNIPLFGVHVHTLWKLALEHKEFLKCCKNKMELCFPQIFHHFQKLLDTFEQSNLCSVYIVKKEVVLYFFYALVSLSTI